MQEAICPSVGKYFYRNSHNRIKNDSLRDLIEASVNVVAYGKLWSTWTLTVGHQTMVNANAGHLA
jgi:hypothetical protein